MTTFRSRFIAAAFVAAFSFPALAAPQEGQAVCDDGAKLRAYLEEKYGEHRVVYAIDAKGNLLELLVNPKTQSWSMLLTVPDVVVDGKRVSCLVGAGKGVTIEWPPVQGTNA